ncbi:MAG: alpha-N-arabinofuranosidase, partial [Prevotella sp.]|nr:alpha-N-arabinofuranosidase [Prevotella sp.]
MKRKSILSAVVLTAALGVNAQKPVTAPAGGKAISNELIGIFFEDLNNSADGGLYAELIQNGAFEFSPVERDGWG